MKIGKQECNASKKFSFEEEERAGYETKGE